MTSEAGTPENLAGVPVGFDPATRRFAIGSTLLAITVAAGIFAPILYHMARHWKLVDDYSHGFLVAPLAVYFAWERRDALRRTPIAPSWWGLLPLALGTMALAVGRLGVELMAMRTAFVLTLIGLSLLLLGPRIFRVLMFPLFFLFLMIPLPQSLVNIIAFPLQLIAAVLPASICAALDSRENEGGVGGFTALRASRAASANTSPLSAAPTHTVCCNPSSGISQKAAHRVPAIAPAVLTA